MIEQVIILGDHIQGLGISRITGRLGYKVFLYNQSAISVARFSNTLHQFICFKDLNHLLKLLMNKDLQGKKTIIFPTNDLMVGFLSDNFQALSEKYVLSISEKKITDLAFNKRNTYECAKSAGIPYPDSYYPNSFEELQAVEPELHYPVILKPAIMYNFYKKAGKKVFRCNSKEELFENYTKAIELIPANEVIIQEMLSGGAVNLFSFASYASKGEVKGCFIANRIRQKPMDFGVATTFAKTVLSERIDTLARKFLKSINYTGVSEVEFMYDEKTRDYKLIEINPRTWKWHTMSNKVGINLIKMLIDDFDGKEIKESINTVENIGWIEQLTDSFVMMSEVLKGRMSYKDYRKSLKGEKEFATWDKKDPLPAIMYILLSPYLYFTR
jgi:predicted ATP-grasp superfamily ATP-dependent carboligase